MVPGLASGLRWASVCPGRIPSFSLSASVPRSAPLTAHDSVRRMCEQLLANTIIENYAYELEVA